MSDPGRVKIAIVGYTEHRRQAPFDHPAWEIWGLNDLYLELPHIPHERLQWFQVHGWEGLVGPKLESVTDFRDGPPHPRDANHVPWLRETSTKLPVWVLDPRPELPEARVIPKEALYAYFNDGYGRPVKYFTNSIAWMIAMAIMRLCPGGPGTPAVEGAEIAVYGVDMMVAGGPGSEYGWQRPSCEYFLGCARFAGIKTFVPRESELLKSAWQYGEQSGEYFRKQMADQRKQLSSRRGEATNAITQAQLAHAELSGAIGVLDRILHNHAPGDPEFADGMNVGKAPLPNSHKGP